jgi:metal-dependent HD superfamily phosphatase/phosphodiesterase
VGKPNASVSSRSFDDSTARAQQTLLLGILHDIQGGAVFDATSRVLELGLAQDVASRLLRKTFQPDEWCVSNGYTGTEKE